MKRALQIVLGVVVLAAGALVVVYRQTGQVGTSSVEAWIGTQVVRVLENYITPTVKFAELDYQAPKTVVFSQLTLEHDGVTIVELDELTLELAEIPRQGQPIKIQQIKVTRPQLIFQQTEGGFIGWSDFVKHRADSQPTAAEGQRFSDILELRHVEINDGELVYIESGDAGKRMTLPGLNFALDTPPIADQPGAYALQGTLKRPHVLDVSLDAAVNLDTSTLTINALDASVALNDEGRDALPPPLQRFLQQHQAKGTLTAKVSGELPLNALDEATANVHVELTDAHVAFAGATIPVGKATLDGTLPDGELNIELVDVALRMGGEPVLAVSRVSATTEGLPTDGEDLVVSNLQIDEPQVSILENSNGDPKSESTIAQNQPDPQDVTSDGLDAPDVVLKSATITDGSVTAQPSPDEQAVELDGIGMTFSAKRAAEDGRLELSGKLSRPPLLDTTFAGTLLTTDNVIDVQGFHLAVTLNKETLAQLPTSLNNRLQQYGVTGALTVDFTGRVPLSAPLDASGEGTLAVQHATLRTGDTVWPIDAFNAQAILAAGSADVGFDGRLLSGDVHGEGTVALAQPRAFDLDWTITGIKIEETLQTLDKKPGAQPQKFAGTVGSTGQTRGELVALPASLSGNGSLTIRDGRLVNLPIIGDILALLSKAPIVRSAEPKDQADIDFELTGEGVRIVKAKIISWIALIRGEGMIGYDQSLDLLVNAGVLGRIQDELGRVGELLNTITDSMVQYTVKGTIEKPKVGVRAFGAGG
ncbi:MAG: hypothetical protein H6817_03375 [Phycisphaerales bacterium]|nr:hypothetical protein [Phycisphaerales bacterium]